MKTVEIKHFHIFSGAGGGAKGFNRGKAEVGNFRANFRCIGGIDVDAAGIRDFDNLAGVKGTVLDLFDRSQYIDFHGKEPPNDWKEASPDDIRRAAGGEFPNIVFLSAPCKGFSGLLAEGKSQSPKYQALNRLTVRGVFLTLEAFKDDLPELIVFENVPRIATRGRKLLDQINMMLEAYGYAVAETTHDCGEIGGLAQSRKRFLLVARHREKVQPFLYEPKKQPLRGVGEIIGQLPLPSFEPEHPMHRIPNISAPTAIRLALVEQGKDWRSLSRLRVEDGWLKDFVLVPEYRGGYLGVNKWGEPVGTVAGRSNASNGAFSIADPRIDGIRHNNIFRVMAYNHHSVAITSGAGPTSGGLAVADPRYNNWHPGASSSKLRITEWDKPSRTVVGASQVASGALAVADPRWNVEKKNFSSGGHYGVLKWDEHSNTIAGSSKYDNGKLSVADPRSVESIEALPDRFIIISEDNTWHRPLTTLELAALQGLIDPNENYVFDGKSDSAWRERIGNAVPVGAAAEIASMMGRTILMARAGYTFSLDNTPIWVRDVGVALAVNV